jgi:hypothetical protein
LAVQVLGFLHQAAGFTHAGGQPQVHLARAAPLGLHEAQEPLGRLVAGVDEQGHGHRDRKIERYAELADLFWFEPENTAL